MNTKSFMWYDIRDYQPEYYEVVDATLVDETNVRIWKAWSEDTNGFVYTIFDTMEIIDVNKIDCWKSNI